MVTQTFLQLLSASRTPGKDPLAQAESMASSLGFSSFEHALLAVEAGQLSPEREEEFLEELRPLVVWAMEHQERRRDAAPTAVHPIEVLLVLIFRFLFGRSQEELERFQLDWRIDGLVDRVEQVELARIARQARADPLDPEAPAVAIRPLVGASR